MIITLDKTGENKSTYIDLLIYTLDWNLCDSNTELNIEMYY